MVELVYAVVELISREGTSEAYMEALAEEKQTSEAIVENHGVVLLVARELARMVSPGSFAAASSASPLDATHAEAQLDG